MSEPWGQQPQQSGGDWSVPQGGEGSGSFAPPPVDPQYGSPQHAGQQPQYGAPQQPAAPFGAAGQPQYGDQPQYGAQPQYGGQPGYGGPGGPGGPGGYGGYIPEQGKNGFSIAGFILCFTVVLGVIFSILGLVRSGKVGGKGRGLAIGGLVLSLLFGGGYAAGLVAVSKSPALDPGCTSAESYFNSMDSKLLTDESNLTKDQSDATAAQADLTTFTADLQNVKNELDGALAKAQHQSVKDKIQAADTDVATMLTGLQAALSGDVTKMTAAEDAANRLEGDGTAIDNLCGTL